MTRYGMLINTKKCVGCYACRMACQMINKLEPEEAFISYKEIEQGTYPSVYAETVPVQCMHCENAPCQQVCPTHATYTTESGVVLVDEEKCIGCKYCMAAVSYTHLDVYKRQVILFAVLPFFWETSPVVLNAVMSACYGLSLIHI